MNIKGHVLFGEKLRALRFISVGLATAGLYSVLFLLLTQFVSKYLAISLAYLTVLPLNFFGHRAVTFLSRALFFPQAFKFLVTQVIIIAALSLLAHISQNFGAHSEIKLLAITVVVIPVLSYIVHLKWTFLPK